MFKIGDKSACLFAFLFSIIGIFYIGMAGRCKSEYARWLKENPTEMSIDLSTVGEYRSVFRQTCQISKGSELFLLLPIDAISEETLTNRLADVRLICRILDRDGTIKARAEFKGKLMPDAVYRFSACPLMRLPPLKNGLYTISIRIVQASQGMRRVPQKIVCVNRLSGMEVWPSFAAFLLGIFSLSGASMAASIPFCAGSLSRSR